LPDQQVAVEAPDTVGLEVFAECWWLILAPAQRTFMRRIWVLRPLSMHRHSQKTRRWP